MFANGDINTHQNLIDFKPHIFWPDLHRLLGISLQKETYKYHFLSASFLTMPTLGVVFHLAQYFSALSLIDPNSLGIYLIFGVRACSPSAFSVVCKNRGIFVICVFLHQRPRLTC
jgi:hypothetical protein